MFKKLTPRQVCDKLSKLKSNRGNWETLWQDIADNILPRKNTVISKKSEGEKREYQVLDSTGMHSNELLAGALHGLLTNPNGEWFELTTGNPELDAQDMVRSWLQKTVRQMHNVLNNSNFQTEIHELYTDLAAFGTSCMLMEQDDERVVRFSTKFIADYWIDENPYGYVDQVYREWKWNASQIVAEFGKKNLPEKITRAFEKGDDTKFCLLHAIYPQYVAGETGRDKYKYVSQYLLPEMELELSVGSFEQNPYVVPRWTKAAGETYGRSPGMNALPEVKVLQRMNETMLIGAQKVVDPPLQLPDDGFIMPIITRPGGLNYYRAGTQDFIRPVFNDTRMDFGYQAMEDRRKRVRDAYFVDQLQLQQGGPMMTATEVLQRTEEKMRLLGPMLGRQQSELLSPLIDRLFFIMWQRGMIDRSILALAPEMRGRKLDVRYSSFIAKSQRANEGQSVLRTMSAAAPFIQMNPAVADNFDGDSIVRYMGQIFGAPQEMYTRLRDMAATRQARAEAQQQATAQAQGQIQAEQFATVASTMKDVQEVAGAGQA